MTLIDVNSPSHLGSGTDTGRVDRNLESYDSLHVIGLGRLRENGPLAETLQEVEVS